MVFPVLLLLWLDGSGEGLEEGAFEAAPRLRDQRLVRQTQLVRVPRGDVLLADGVQFSINCWRAAHVVSRVKEGAQSTCVVLREPVILARHDELINEIPEVRLIQIHELVYVRWGYRVATVVCLWKSLRERAAVDSTER
jgi:hypothetical protein